LQAVGARHQEASGKRRGSVAMGIGACAQRAEESRGNVCLALSACGASMFARGGASAERHLEAVEKTCVVSQWWICRLMAWLGKCHLACTRLRS
jgi:hypothetical protein